MSFNSICYDLKNLMVLDPGFNLAVLFLRLAFIRQISLLFSPNTFVETNLVVLGGQGWLPRDTAHTSAVPTVGDDHILFCENRTM